MSTPTRLQKEQALRAAGVVVAPYPALATSTALDARAADIALLNAWSEWEHRLDIQYFQMIQRAEAEDMPEVQAVLALCDQQGLGAALAELNRRVAHRYTALYRLDGEYLQNIELYDKASEQRPDFLAKVPLSHSFCQYVLRDGSFLTSDSGADDRLDGHPYKGVMVSYHGVPVVNEEGGLVGSLCHFDIEAQPLADDEFRRLQAVGRRIARYVAPA